MYLLRHKWSPINFHNETLLKGFFFIALYIMEVICFFIYIKKIYCSLPHSSLTILRFRQGHSVLKLELSNDSTEFKKGEAIQYISEGTSKMCNTHSPKKNNGKCQDCFRLLQISSLGWEMQCSAAIEQISLFCLDHQHFAPSVVTSEHFCIEAQLHHCKALYKLPQQAYPYPKQTQTLEHAVKNICFSHIIQWIVQPDTEQEKPSLQMPCILRTYEHQEKKSSQKFIPGLVCSLSCAMHKGIQSWEKLWRRGTSSAITRNRIGCHSSCFPHWVDAVSYTPFPWK